MNNPNPFVPQGSLLEQKNKTRSRVKVAVFCVVAINVLGLTALLMQGCKREQTEVVNPTPESLGTPTNPTPELPTNPVPELPTNPAIPPSVGTTVPPTVPEVAGNQYVVVQGDTLSGIAKKNGVTLRALEVANPGVEPTKLKVGQKLSIPAPTANATAPTGMVPAGGTGGGELYTVKSGDTLTKIAHTYGVTVKAIETENNLTTTQIKVGQKLKIPAKAETAPAPAPDPVTPAPATVPGMPPAQ